MKINKVKSASMHYSSKFTPSEFALGVLRKGKIISSEETPAQMVDRVVTDLVGIEKFFGSSEAEIKILAERIGSAMDSGKVVLVPQ